MRADKQTDRQTSHMGTMRHVRRAAIWALGHKSKKPTRVDAYVDGEYRALKLANLVKNCRTSRVWRDPLSCLDLTAATQQQHRPLARPAVGADRQTYIGYTHTYIHTDRQTSWNNNKAHSLRT